MKIYSKGYTHAGKFHADDVFSTALLMHLNPDFKVVRVNKLPENPDGIVYDIGGGKFDHHQTDSPARDNGIPYGAFGLLWKEYGAYIMENEESALQFDQKFVSAIDYADNTGEYDSLSAAVSSFVPPWNSSESIDSAFEKAVDFAFNILDRLIQKSKATRLADELVMNAYKESVNNIVILNQYMPWEKVLTDTDAVFVIYPSLRGGYNIHGVPVEHGSNIIKKPFPPEWCGREDSEIVLASGIGGLRFCHKNGFLASAETLDSAIKAAELAIAL